MQIVSREEGVDKGVGIPHFPPPDSHFSIPFPHFPPPFPLPSPYPHFSQPPPKKIFPSPKSKFLISRRYNKIQTGLCNVRSCRFDPKLTLPNLP